MATAPTLAVTEVAATNGLTTHRIVAVHLTVIAAQRTDSAALREATRWATVNARRNVTSVDREETSAVMIAETEVVSAIAAVLVTVAALATVVA